MTTWLKVTEVAARLNTSPAEIRKLIRARHLGCLKLNPDAKRPTYRVSDKHLEQYERQRTRSAY